MKCSQDVVLRRRATSSYDDELGSVRKSVPSPTGPLLSGTRERASTLWLKQYRKLAEMNEYMREDSGHESVATKEAEEGANAAFAASTSIKFVFMQQMSKVLLVPGG